MSSPSYQKFALLLACNYYGVNRLRGCINDAMNIKDFLINQRGFSPENVKTVLDKQMTIKGIWRALDELLEKTEAVVAEGRIPSVFLYYSGHGLQVAPNKDESEDRDGDEALVPYDFERGDLIVDDELYTRFISRLPARTELFIFTDCCNSGSNFDLAYTGEQHEGRAETEAKIIHLSGCRDNQTSAEIQGYGVATNHFLKIIGPSVRKVSALQKAMKDVSTMGNQQNPQVSVSQKSMYKGELFPWLIQNIETKQLNRKQLRRLIRARKPSFFSRLFQNLISSR